MRRGTGSCIRRQFETWPLYRAHDIACRRALWTMLLTNGGRDFWPVWVFVPRSTGDFYQIPNIKLKQILNVYNYTLPAGVKKNIHFQAAALGRSTRRKLFETNEYTAPHCQKVNYLHTTPTDLTPFKFGDSVISFSCFFFAFCLLVYHYGE